MLNVYLNSLDNWNHSIKNSCHILYTIVCYKHVQQIQYMSTLTQRANPAHQTTGTSAASNDTGTSSHQTTWVMWSPRNIWRRSACAQRSICMMYLHTSCHSLNITRHSWMKWMLLLNLVTGDSGWHMQIRHCTMKKWIFISVNCFYFGHQ